MKPENATIAVGRGRPRPRPTAKLITAPCEKPPITTFSCGSESTKPAAAAKPSRERLGIGKADARHDVPVRAARRQRQRRARAEAVEAALGVERVEQRHQVELVGAAAVEEDERALGLAGGAALLDAQAPRAGRGAG